MMYLPIDNVESIVEAAKRAPRQAGDVLMLLIGEADKALVPELIEQLRTLDVPFFGGIFPRIVAGDMSYEHGAVLTVLPAAGAPFLIRGLDQGKLPSAALPESPAMANDLKYTTMLLVDGLTTGIAPLLSSMFNRFGDSCHYFGGGAGSLSLQQQPCVFTAEGFFQDAAVGAFVGMESQLGVRHGWQRLAGPIVATRTRRNVVVELNWRNAFDVYREVVEADAGASLSAENFFSIAKRYPFGIFREGTETIVRDPIVVNDAGELICVGEVPENTVLHILKGKPASLIRAAGQAAADCRPVPGRTARQALVVDCISRVLFLEEEFPKELGAVTKKLKSLNKALCPEGALTLGEISSYGEGSVEFFNKTMVVGVLYA